jgi:predicted RNase H-like nuclease
MNARKFLSPEGHYSIFNCPFRDAAYAEGHRSMRINEEKTGKKISKEAWNITPKIREANQVEKNRELRESHPEVFFKSIKKLS